MRVQVCREVRGTDRLELDLQEVTNLSMWILGAELRSSAKVVHVLSYRAVSMLLTACFLVGQKAMNTSRREMKNVWNYIQIKW